jgi:hypothetical protein
MCWQASLKKFTGHQVGKGPRLLVEVVGSLARSKLSSAAPRVRRIAHTSTCPLKTDRAAAIAIATAIKPIRAAAAAASLSATRAHRTRQKRRFAAAAWWTARPGRINPAASRLLLCGRQTHIG